MTAGDRVRATDVTGFGADTVLRAQFVVRVGETMLAVADGGGSPRCASRHALTCRSSTRSSSSPSVTEISLQHTGHVVVVFVATDAVTDVTLAGLAGGPAVSGNRLLASATAAVATAFPLFFLLATGGFLKAPSTAAAAPLALGARLLMMLAAGTKSSSVSCALSEAGMADLFKEE